MLEATIHRFDRTSQGTFGRITLSHTNKSFFTGELPWHDNKTNISCIPTAEWCVEHGYCLPDGTYYVTMRLSPKFGWSYWISTVPARSFCLIHPANLMGDTNAGYRSQLNGCVALGCSLGWLDGQKAVLRSRPAILSFMSLTHRQPFTLTITNA